MLGGYELVERVGRGGMASLFLARRAGARGFVRPVAVKLVHSHLLEDSNFVEMFIDEANVCARLSHPNIVHIEELVEVDGALFIVMEFVEGCSLGKLLNFTRKQRQQVPVPMAVHIIAKAADGLHAAHEARGDHDEPLDLVHRDMSPTNLLLSRRGNVKIIDFGIAKFSSRLHHTRTQRLKGKVAYMSPEQVNRGEVDRRSDIYSLGVVLWETLAHRRAYRAKDEVSLMRQVMKRTIPPIESIRDDLPDELVSALNQALQPEPDARFETAHEFYRALTMAVPEAALVTSKDIGEAVRRVMESEGQADSSHLKVRTSTGTGSYPEDTVAVTGDSIVQSSSVSHEVAASSHPGTSQDRALMIGVLIAGLVAIVLLGVMVMITFDTTEPASVPPPVADVAPPPTTAPPPPAKAEAPAEEPDAEDPEVEVAAEVIEDEDTEEDEAEATVEPKRRRRVARSRRRARARRAEPKKEPENPQAVPTYLIEEETPTRSVSARPSRETTKVDDVLLADQDDLDRAAMKSDAKTKTTEVEQDGTVLADDYQ
ncbi:MAG: serine/threonine-protein kinase [Deltaproteobacteria bacterium]